MNLWHIFIFLAMVAAAPIVVLQGFRWLVLPLRIKRKQRIKLQVKMEPTEVERLTPETREFMGRMIREFLAEGFEVEANALVPNMLKGSQAVQALLVNRRSGDLGIVLGTFVKTSRSLVFGIRSIFPDGRRIWTGVKQSLSFMPPNPQEDAINFAWVKDVATLAEVHRRRLRTLGRENEARTAVAPGEGWQYLEEARREEFGRMVQCGYYRPDADGAELRQTIKGAYLATWKLMEPIKSWRRRRRDRKARRVWTELGMDQWMMNRLDPAAVGPDNIAMSGVASNAEDGNVRYESALRDGELRVEQRGAAVMVRLGRQTRGEMLAGQWPRLLFITFLVVSLAKLFWNTWMLIQIFGWRMFQAMRAPTWLVWAGIALAFLVWEVVRLALKIAPRPVPMVVTASAEGLFYENAPARPCSGTVAREQVSGIYTGLRKFGIFRRTYVLLIVCYDGRRLILLTAPRIAVLEQAATVIKRGMGMSVEESSRLAAAATAPE